MLKFILKSICFCLLLIYHGEANKLSGQSLYGKVLYTATIDTAFVQKSLEESKSKHPASYPMLKETLNRGLEIAKTMEIALHFNQTEGLCFVERDAMFADEDPLAYNAATAFIGIGPDRYYINNKEKSRIRETSMDDGVSYIHVQRDWKLYDWELSAVTKQIGSYTCRKATASRQEETSCCGTIEYNITAWYAPELPYPFGPAAYYDDLPGLVLEIEEMKGKRRTILRAECIEIDSKSKKKIPQLYKVQRLTTEKELDKEAEEFMGAIRKN